MPCSPGNGLAHAPIFLCAHEAVSAITADWGVACLHHPLSWNGYWSRSGNSFLINDAANASFAQTYAVSVSSDEKGWPGNAACNSIQE